LEPKLPLPSRCPEESASHPVSSHLHLSHARDAPWQKEPHELSPFLFASKVGKKYLSP